MSGDDDEDLQAVKNRDDGDGNTSLILDRNWVLKLVQQGGESSADASTTTPDIENDIHHHPSVRDKILATAPMIEQSDTAFRILTRRYGSNLCFTPMIHAYSFVKKASYRQKMFHFSNDDDSNTRSEDRPLIAQIAGSNKEVLLKCAQMLEPYVDAIDLNFGCPTLTAKRGRYGAYLLGSGDYVFDIVKHLVDNINQCPITCKVRLLAISRSRQKEERQKLKSNKETIEATTQEAHLGYDLQASLRLYKSLIDAGARMLTIHGRTKDMKGEYSQAADWDAIRAVVEELGHRVPILANGGLASYEDVIRCLEYTNADGVMSSEAILEYPPSLYTYHRPTSIDDYITTTTAKLPRTRPRPGPGRLGIAREYLELCRQYPPSEGNGGTDMQCISMHMLAFLHGEWASSSGDNRRDINDNRRNAHFDVDLVDDDILDDDATMQSEIRNSKTVDDLIEVLNILEKRHERINHKVEDETLSWYYRHWRPDN
mmetsp:Transcript_54811/g.133113  ORF Transcript_54811/g.133113 Transcript_54811/m.133113 type:complete len:485 (+) Transcript_54811:167-1621(+)